MQYRYDPDWKLKSDPRVTTKFVAESKRNSITAGRYANAWMHEESMAGRL